MIDLRIRDVAYPGLPYVFTPAGIRLVAKSEGAPPTTSVLVRGAGGTGKTTLGLALAHALAKASHGIALYVATETSLADVIDKASVIKLGETAVVSYDPAAVLAEGAVALAHLVVAREDAAQATPSTLAKMVVEYAYELASAPQAGAPVRAVVIDSFELPEGDGPKLGRSELAAFVQSLEGLGVSPVFIEEFSAGMSERLTFVVDIVLQLALASDAPSATLYRRLAVLKSRYSQSVAGPHEMAIDEGVPTVWPDSPSLDFGGPRAPVGVVVPLADDKQGPPTVLAINRGALVLSFYDVDELTVISALERSPGIAEASVDCGPHIRVVDAENAGTVEIASALGPGALAWALHRVLASRRANAVTFHRLEHLLAQPRFASALPSLLTGLTRNGFVVCVHGARKKLDTIETLADYSGPSGPCIESDVKVVVPRRYRAATAWTKGPPGLTAPVVKNDIGEHLRIAAAVQAAKDRLTADDLDGAHRALNISSQWQDPAVHWALIEIALLLDRLGISSKSREHLEVVASDSTEDIDVRSALAWAFTEIGAEWDAFWLAFKRIAQPDPPDAVLRLWRTAFLRYSGATFPFSVAEWNDPIQARFVAQGLAGRDRLDVADKVLRLAAAHQGLAAVHLERLLADVRLESSKPASWRDADARYIALEDGGGLSRLERADIRFNRGVIAERLGDVPLAIERFRAAKELNPFLEMAHERLAALGASTSTSAPEDQTARSSE